MKILVCGGRSYSDRAYVYETLDKFHKTFKVTFLIQGGATGADLLAKDWADERDLPCQTYKADWNKYGRAAGPRRNARMIKENTDLGAVIAFPGNTGTEDMIDKAKKAGIQVFYVFD